MRKLIPTLALATTLAWTSCGPLPPSTGNIYADIHNRGQVKVCEKVAGFGADYAWTKRQQGVPLPQALDGVDRATASASASRYARFATEVIYANPQWTEQYDAFIGVERACQRATMY